MTFLDSLHRIWAFFDFITTIAFIYYFFLNRKMVDFKSFVFSFLTVGMVILVVGLAFIITRPSSNAIIISFLIGIPLIVSFLGFLFIRIKNKNGNN